jgi:hypothetical protein
MTSQPGVTCSSSTPRRFATSFATSTSKPSIWLLLLRNENGGYSASSALTSFVRQHAVEHVAAPGRRGERGRQQRRGGNHSQHSFHGVFSPPVDSGRSPA